MNKEDMLKYFYLIVSIIFLGVGIFNSWALVITWDNLLLPVKVSNLLGNIFNYLLSFFFGYFFIDTLPKKKKFSEEELEEMFKGVKDE